MKISIYFTKKGGEGKVYAYREDISIYELEELEIPTQLMKDDVEISFSLDRSCEKCNGRTYTETTCRDGCND